MARREGSVGSWIWGTGADRSREELLGMFIEHHDGGNIRSPPGGQKSSF